MPPSIQAIWQYRIRKVMRYFRDDFSHNAYEKAEYIYYLRYLTHGMTVFDVGANIGELSLLFAHFVGEGGAVHSFEASSGTYARLRRIVHESGFNNIQLVDKGVSASSGYATFYDYGDGHSGWSSLANRPLEKYGIDIKPVSLEKIAVVSLDDYCSEHGIDFIDLLKVDVEGAEFQVLQGASRMFKEKRIGVCLFETGQTTKDMGNDYDDVFDWVRSFGYRLRGVLPGVSNKSHFRYARTGGFAMHVAERKNDKRS